MTSSPSASWKAVLDSCILIDYLRGRPEAISYLTSHDPKDFVITAVTVLELCEGDLSKKKHVDATINLLAKFDVTIPTEEDWVNTLLLVKARYSQRNNRPKWSDTLIATAAKSLQIKLVSRDESDFRKIEPDPQWLDVPYTLPPEPEPAEKKYCVKLETELWNKLQGFDTAKAVNALRAIVP